MTARVAAVLAALCTACAPSPDAPEVWTEGPSLPQPLSNNAVAAVETPEGVSVFTFLGLDSTKVWSGVTNVAYRWDTWTDAWRAIEPVPGPGRLASTAHVVDGRIYVIGGYTVAEDGSEKSLPDVAIYDPVAEEWSAGTDIPVPTDDAAAGVWNSDWIVLVSGWHDTGNIRDMQIYHPPTDSWEESTPIPGEPVFGHTGTMVGESFVYVDGAAIVDARPRFVIDTASWVGHIVDVEPGIAITEWVPAPPHPGPPLYRAAAGSWGGLALFVGGTDNPYNYSGIGYNGVPTDPLRQLLAFEGETMTWRSLPPLPLATMDHRNAGVAGDRIFMVGGMLAGQVVSDRVWWADANVLTGGGVP